MKYLLCAFTLLLASLSYANNSFNEGEHYQSLPLPATNTAKVVEYFSYYCPFCYNFEPVVAELKQALPTGIVLQKIPVAFHGGPMAPDVQRAHALAETLNVSELFSTALFAQIHQQRKPPQNRNALKQLFAELGVDNEKFDANFNSMPINTLISEYDQAIRTANIRSVPSFIVNDKYLVNISAVSSQQQFNALINHLLSLTPGAAE
ncbi:MAG: thiol:disulfide interchange protein DsbA/DsbL [Gammaproteobacteria bacterium]|nr:thiol:disulfide interchange protein DsbA/DsbL [Gammaproteobacteria bacterium]MBU2182271.1 thiol:disulfide interchange protein DsbA/DsbL [Gammaproteobacteria bacterium]